MGRARKKRRGFNQAELIARQLAMCTKQDRWQHYLLPLLIKTKEGVSQTTLEKKHRFQNVKNVFAVGATLKKLPKKVVLVDDIWTTGSTMKECCKTLKKAGVRSVWGFSVARAL